MAAAPASRRRRVNDERGEFDMAVLPLEIYAEWYERKAPLRKPISIRR
jgi:hypothetical protein